MTHILAALALTLTANADLGPKPTAFFDWKIHPGVALGTVKLLQCKDSACKDASPLQPLGPQRFGCCEAGCFAMAYGFSEFGQLAATIDGTEVTSAPFAIGKPDAFFEVASGRGKLDVRAVRSLPEERKNSLQYCK